MASSTFEYVRTTGAPVAPMLYALDFRPAVAPLLAEAALESLTSALRMETTDFGVSIVLVRPGAIATEFQEVAGVRTDEIPDFAWMSAEAVVEASLEALRRGDLLVIPGGGNRVMGAVIRALPASLARRVGAAVLRRSLGG